MPLLRLAPLTALTVAALVSTACTTRADSPTPLIASVNRSGEVTVRRAADERVVATIRPGIFEQTWQQRGVSRGADYAAGPNGAVDTQSVINAPTAGTTLAVHTTIAAEGDRLSVRCEMTPEKPVAVNSAQVSVSLPASSYVGTAWSSGGQAGTVPPTAKDVVLVGGLTAPLSVGAGDKQVRVSATGSPVLLQDDRVFGSPDLEIRVGPQETRTMPAGRAEAIALTVDLPGAVTLEREEPITLTAGGDWVPLDLKLDIAAGSALDFSPMLQDAPAGKYGRVIVRGDGHFGFERRDKPVRFYGVNLCFSANYLDHDEADRLADRLARIGYNTVRIHHYESGLVDDRAADSLTFRADSLDKLDYLIAALKKRGIYVKTDLFVSRPVRPSETGVGAAEAQDYKAALLVSPPAMENWKAFSRKLLTHINPYTGLAYKDDPVLAFLSLVNEPNATTFFGSLKGELRARYEAEWTAYLKACYPNDAAMKAAWNDPSASLSMPLPDAINDTSPGGREAAAFVTTLHLRAWHTMSDFLRKEVGTKALLTYLNGWSEAPPFMVARTEFDWVDNHFYWDHPHFLEKDWRLPSEGGSGGASAIAAGGAGPNGFAMTRLFGKPFTWSEYNYAAPNRYRAEGGLIMGAASALQGWDAVWRFAYSHSHDAVIRPEPLDYFNMVSDPAGQASERAALMLFLRGDITPAPDALALVQNAQDLMTKPTAASAPGFGDLTLVARVGTRVEAPGQPLPTASPSEIRLPTGAGADGLTALKRTGRLPTSNGTDLAGPRRDSETGEISVDGEKGSLRIAAARTCGGIALPGDTITAGPLTVVVADARAAIWASSLDGRPVAASKRLLLCHVTDVENSNMRYSAPDRRVLEDWGGLPHLARRGTATVILRRKPGERLDAWRLDTAGNRVAPLPVEAVGAAYTLRLDTRAPDGKATLYYEVVAR